MSFFFVISPQGTLCTGEECYQIIIYKHFSNGVSKHACIKHYAVYLPYSKNIKAKYVTTLVNVGIFSWLHFMTASRPREES